MQIWDEDLYRYIAPHPLRVWAERVAWMAVGSAFVGLVEGIAKLLGC